MCEVADRLWNSGKEEGLIVGREEGREEGRKLGAIEILSDLVKDGTLSITDAAKKMGMSISAFKTAIKK